MSAGERGGFFAVGKAQWAQACKLGLNPAVAFAVLACGTGRDNSTTCWGAESVSKYGRIAWRRASRALATLEESKLALRARRKGDRITRKLVVPKDKENLIWLPNALVSGAASEVPPLARLRQSQNVEHLQAFVELYGLHDLVADGGLPRSLVYQPFEREFICDAGQFKVWGYRREEASCYLDGPLVRFKDRKSGQQPASWAFLNAIMDMGLLARADYLLESDEADAEIIHALSGDEWADGAAATAQEMAESLPGGFPYAAENFDYVLPVLRHVARAAVVGGYRLTYRPHTSQTAAWYAQHVHACKEAEARYRSLAAGEFASIEKVAS